ncbi:MAG: M14 family metallopeptidase [Thermoanaerobaculaceae bacterium]
MLRKTIFMLSLAFSLVEAGVPSPKEFLQKDVGQDRVLANYQEVVDYLRELAKDPRRVKLLELGPTVEGRPMLALVVSSPANMARLEAIRTGWAKLADPRGLGEDEKAKLIQELPAGVLVTAGIHSTEVAGTQTSLLFIHELLAAAPQSALARWLDQVVVAVVPSLNPDGHEAVVAWYETYLGTPYEGALPPFLYHRYAGHDNNRDFVFLTQPESRALNRFVYRYWHPQLFVDLHQMGAAGPRQFVPPFADPINPHLPPVLWRLTSCLGAHMALRLEQAGKAGVVSGWTFDGHWIGGTRNTAWWKNIVGVLTETASAALATPIWVDPSDLRAQGKGLWAYLPQVNFPNPWGGGRWGLVEAVSYQRDLLRSAVEFAALYRKDLLEATSGMAEDAILSQGGPWGWVVPPEGDPGRRKRLVDLLLEAGVEGYLAPRGLTGSHMVFPPASLVFPFRQPLGRYLWELLEKHDYPEIIPAPGADILLPYDVTAWHLPSMLGVKVVRADEPLEGGLEKLADLLQPPRGAVTGEILAIPAWQLELHALANEALRRGLKPCRLSHPQGKALPAGSLIVTAPAATLAELLRGRSVQPQELARVPESCSPLLPVRVAVYHPFTPAEDAGWLRWVLEQGGFTPVVLNPKTILEEPLGHFHVAVLPDMEAQAFQDSPGWGLVPPPPEFQLGLTQSGVEKLKEFVEQGGTLLAFKRSAEWVGEKFHLSVTNPLAGVPRSEFFAPGALVEMEVEGASPLAWGLPPRVPALIDGGVAFASSPSELQRRQVVCRFSEKPQVLSGFLRGAEKLARKATMVAYAMGKGRVVLYSFAPHFRGQTANLFPLVFNSLWLAGGHGGP